MGGIAGGHTLMVKRYENSPKDLKEDQRGAKQLGVSLKAYEKTARDKREDRAGQKAMLRSSRASERKAK